MGKSGKFFVIKWPYGFGLCKLFAELIMEIFNVNEECISCHACVEVAGNNFEMGSNNLAYVKRQPQNEMELKQTKNALEVCPVNAIISEEVNENTGDKKPILGTDNVKETLDRYPHLKDVLVSYSARFKRLLNPGVYNTLARFATFSDASRVSGESVCEILHVLNNALGTMQELYKMAPDCIKGGEAFDLLSFSSEINWQENPERYIYNSASVPEIIEMVNKLAPGKNLVVIATEEPVSLVKAAHGLGYQLNVIRDREYRISIFNPPLEEDDHWRERKEDFDILDVRTMQTDPFDIIIQTAYATPEGDGFCLIQRFMPFPIVNMLTEMGFEYEVEPYSSHEFRVYFYKTPVIAGDNNASQDKTEVVIQSATPVAYPVIMRLLQSENLRSRLKIKELKVWEETEKHLAWITSGRADISFSAIITAIKLRNSDIKIPAFFVWDNFVLLSRRKISSLADVKGTPIYTPLFEEAPPTKITKYLLRAKGFNPDDYEFHYGAPFGRPEEIYAAFVQGDAETVILREPEASYAIKIMADRGQDISVIAFADIWNEVNPGFGSFPNAGLVVKGEFAQKNPELLQIFLEELKDAIEWVNNNRTESARMSFDLMRQPEDRIELFLNRVRFQYMDGDPLIEKTRNYFGVLKKEGIIDAELDESFYDIFRLENP